MTWGPEGGRRNHVQPEDDETIKQNLNVKMYWFLCTYMTRISPITCELFKGRDTEVTHSLQNEAHVGLHKHQPQNWGWRLQNQLCQ